MSATPLAHAGSFFAASRWDRTYQLEFLLYLHSKYNYKMFFGRFAWGGESAADFTLCWS